jgi:hypothetical protein
MTEQTWWWRERWESFRRGSSPLSISWEGGEARALLFDEGAPETVAALSRVLPLEVPVVHVAWSGEMLMSTTSYDLGAPRENSVRLPHPGDLTWDPDAGELAFAYGTAECRLPSGENTVVVYGSIVEGLEPFAGFCWRRRFEGVGTLRLSPPHARPGAGR